jgi:hypothetical protein
MPNINLTPHTSFEQIRTALSHGSPDKHIRGSVNRIYTSAKASLQSFKIKTGLFKDTASTSRTAERQAGAANIKSVLDNEFGKGTGARLFRLIEIRSGRNPNQEITRADLDAIHGMLDVSKADDKAHATAFRGMIDELYGAGTGGCLFYLVEKQNGREFKDGLKSQDLAAIRTRMEGLEAATDKGAAKRALIGEVIRSMAKETTDVTTFLRANTESGKGLVALIRPAATAFFESAAGTVRANVLAHESFVGKHEDLLKLSAEAAKPNIERACDAHDLGMRSLVGGKTAEEITSALQKMPDELKQIYATLADSAYRGAKDAGKTNDEAAEYAEVAVNNFFTLRYYNPALLAALPADPNRTLVEADKQKQSLVVTAALIQSTFNKTESNTYQAFKDEVESWHGATDLFIKGMIEAGRKLNSPNVVSLPDTLPVTIDLDSNETNFRPVNPNRFGRRFEQLTPTVRIPRVPVQRTLVTPTVPRRPEGLRSPANQPPTDLQSNPVWRRQFAANGTGGSNTQQ